MGQATGVGRVKDANQMTPEELRALADEKEDFKKTPKYSWGDIKYESHMQEDNEVMASWNKLKETDPKRYAEALEHEKNKNMRPSRSHLLQKVCDIAYDLHNREEEIAEAVIQLLEDEGYVSFDE